MYNKVYVEITNICNMSCSFCHGHKRKPHQMSMDDFKLVLEKLTDQTKYIYYHLMGEPLMHPELIEFIKIAGEKGFKSIITTNGTLLPELGCNLIEAGIHKINISLHSFEKGNEIELTKHLESLAEFSKSASDRGVIVVFRLWNQGCDNGINSKTLELLRRNISGDWVENSRGLRIKNKMFLEYGERFQWPDENADVKGEKFYCYGLKDQFGILSDGTVVPCCLDSDGVISLGNIFTEDLSKILNSERARDIVNGFKKGTASEELCKRCGYAQRFVR